MRKALFFSTIGMLVGIATTVAATALQLGPVPVSVSSSQMDPATARKEVEQAIEHFRKAMVERRPEWILSDSAAELTFGHSNGIVQSRQEFAEVVRSGAEIFKRIDITDRRLTISQNTAIERHHFSADIIYNGQLQTFELEVVEVWQKSDRWRLIARQAVKV